MRKHRKLIQRAGVLAIAAAWMVAAAHPALASQTSGGSALPWESPLQTLSNSLKGPVAYGIALIGIVVAGGTLIFGGELSEFSRRAVMLVLVIALLVLATSVLTTLFTSATVF